MKIKELNQRCGGCELIDYCGNAFGYCICTDSRFREVEDEQYKKFADNAEIKAFEACRNCNELCSDCDIEEEARDYKCRQIADFVEKALQENYVEGEEK